MQRLQQMKASILSVDIQMVIRLTAQLRLRNTKKEAGKLLETWRQVEIVIALLPRDIPQWLLVVIHIQADHC